jgi:hypothetical protein
MAKDEPEATMSLVLKDNEATLYIEATTLKTRAEADQLVEKIHLMAASLPDTNKRRGKKASRTKPKSSHPTASRRRNRAESDAADDDAQSTAL